jgi:hypothetical protein
MLFVHLAKENRRGAFEQLRPSLGPGSFADDGQEEREILRVGKQVLNPGGPGTARKALNAVVFPAPGSPRMTRAG